MAFEHLSQVEKLAIQARSKIRVHYADGVFRGGLLKLAYRNRNRDRVMNGPGTPTHREYLWEWPHSEPGAFGSWFRIFLANEPNLEGASDGSDCFDSASWAIRLEPNDVVAWLRANAIAVPEDILAHCAADQATREPTPASESHPRFESPLTDTQAAVLWILASSGDRPTPSKDIEAALSDADINAGTGSVKSKFVRALRRWFNAQGRPNVILSKHRCGFWIDAEHREFALSTARRFMTDSVRDRLRVPDQ